MAFFFVVVCKIFIEQGQFKWLSNEIVPSQKVQKTALSFCIREWFLFLHPARSETSFECFPHCGECGIGTGGTLGVRGARSTNDIDLN